MPLRGTLSTAVELLLGMLASISEHLCLNPHLLPALASCQWPPREASRDGINNWVPATPAGNLDWILGFWLLEPQKWTSKWRESVCLEDKLKVKKQTNKQKTKTQHNKPTTKSLQLSSHWIFNHTVMRWKETKTVFTRISFMECLSARKW